MRFSLIYAGAILCSFAESGAAEELIKKRDISTTFLKMNETLDMLTEKVHTGNTVMDNNQTVFVKENILNSDNNHHTQEMASGIEIMLKKMELFEVRFQALEEKTNEIFQVKELLLKMSEKLDQAKKQEVTSELTSQCTSMCESKVIAWTNHSVDRFIQNMLKLDFCINSAFENDQKTSDEKFTSNYNSNVCNPNPCLNSENCIALSTNSYRCRKCPPPTSGTNCEYLNCGKADRCFHMNRTAYFVFEKRLNWAEANQLCAEEGMKLAQLKDKERSDFVTDHLNRTYARHPTACFWLGLRNNANGQHWQWTDGSPFDGYTGPTTGLIPFIPYPEERCGIMYFYDGNLTWSPHLCIWLNEPYQHYPLCQIDIKQSII